MSAPRVNPVPCYIASAAPLLIATTWPEAARLCDARGAALVAVNGDTGECWLISGLADWMTLHGCYSELRAVPLAQLEASNG